MLESLKRISFGALIVSIDADQKEVFDFLRQNFVEAIALIDTINYGK